MGGISGLISGAGNFLGSQLGQGLLQLGQAGLGYMSGQEQADLARELAAQSQFRPYNVQGPLGAVTVEGQDISISPTEQQRQLQQGLFGAAQRQLGVAGAPALAGIVSRTPSQVEQLAQSFIGQTLEVLWESVREGHNGTVWSGMTDNYLRVTTLSSANLANRLLSTRLVALAGDRLQGEVETEKRGMG